MTESIPQSSARTSPGPVGDPGKAHRHYKYEKTIAFPDTYASVRGSDVLADLANLSESRLTTGEHSPRFSVQNPNPEADEAEGPTPHKNDPSVLNFDNVALNVKVEEWLLEREQPMPYPPYLSLRKHFLRIINTLNYDEKILEVGNYMTVNDVLKFYLEYNTNSREYVWKDIWGNSLQMSKSLGENGLMDNSIIIDEIGLDHFPTILLYFKDGFENDPPLKLDISQPEPTGLNAPCRNY